MRLIFVVAMMLLTSLLLMGSTNVIVVGEGTKTNLQSYQQTFGNRTNNKYLAYDTTDYKGFIQWNKTIDNVIGKGYYLQYRNVVYSLHDNVIFGMDIEGNEIINTTVDDHFIYHPALDDSGNIYTGTKNNSINKYSNQGHLIKRIELKNPITSPIYIWNNRMIFYDEKNIISMGLNGEFLWDYEITTDLLDYPAISNDGTIYSIYSGDSILWDKIISISSNGTMDWEKSLKEYGENFSFKLYDRIAVDDFNNHRFSPAF
jgi:hypothetical protein